MACFGSCGDQKITPSSEALDFVIIAMSVVSADKAILRRNSPDGWTRQINLEIPLQKAEEWEKVKDKLEKMLRFLSGDFWKLTFTQLPESIALDNFTEDRDKDCVCLLSGGMDSLVGGIDLCEYGKNHYLLLKQCEETQLIKGSMQIHWARTTSVNGAVI